MTDGAASGELPDDDRVPVARPIDDGAGSTRELPRDRRSAARQLVRFIPDLGRLLLSVSKDPRVSLRSKLTAGAVAAYLVSPVDVIPDFIPVAGQMDDVALALWGFRQLLQSAGYDVLKEHWSGSDDGFVLLLFAAGVEE